MGLNHPWARQGATILLATALALSAGCAGRSGSADATAARSDAPEGDGEMSRRVAIRFALEVPNDVTGPVYVLLNGADDQPGWIQASRGVDRVYFRPRCEVEDCANPGVVCGAAMSMIRIVAAPGRAGMIELVWDGMTSVVPATSRCETREPAPPGNYVARFCYSREADFQGDPSSAVPGRLIRPTCTDMSFTLGDTEVVLRI